MGCTEKTHQIWDYGVNYLAFLLMQVMGNGVTSLDTMMSMFGLGVHSGSHREWTYISCELGNAEQRSTDKIQDQNIYKKVLTQFNVLSNSPPWLSLRAPLFQNYPDSHGRCTQIT